MDLSTSPCSPDQAYFCLWKLLFAFGASACFTHSCVCVCAIADIFVSKNVNTKSTQDLQKNSANLVHHLFVM